MLKFLCISRFIRLTLVFLTGYVVLPAYSQAAQPRLEPLDRIAVIINNEVVTLHELNARVALIEQRLRQQRATVPPIDQLRAQVLEQLVLERVQLQKAKESGLKVDDAALERTLLRLAQANHLDVTQYRARLEAQGVPWSLFLRDTRTELLLAKLREQEVDRTITVSDAEIMNYLANQQSLQMPMPQTVRIRQILIKVPLEAEPTAIAALRHTAETVLQQALSGADFAALAARYSTGPAAAQGGDLAWQAVSALPERYRAALVNLHAGQVNPALIRTEQGFVVIQLVERRALRQHHGADLKMVQRHARHILLRVSQDQPDAQVLQTLRDLSEKITQGAHFEQLAQQYSQDASAKQGGDLGWISPGDTVPVFERALNQLQDGQLSGPVRTEYGYHLIQVLARRDAPDAIAEQHLRVRQVLGQRKAEHAFSEWLRRLRDSAYVQYKLNQPG